MAIEEESTSVPEFFVDFPLEDDIAAMVASLRQNQAADPTVLALQGVEIFLQFSHKEDQLRPLEVDAEIRNICRAVGRVRPDCAPLVNLASDMIQPLTGFYGRGQGAGMRAELRERVEQWRGEMLWREGQRMLRAARLIEEGARLLCHGYSADVVGALREANSAGRAFSVRCLAGRPGQDGHALAEELARHSIGAEVVAVDAQRSAVDQATLVLVGAYALSEQGLVNRAGTHALARRAKEQQVPFYTLCGPEKFVPAGYEAGLSGRPNAVSGTPPGPSEGEVSKPEWDVTPLEYLSGVVTDRVVLAADELPAILAKRRVDPLLLA